MGTIKDKERGKNKLTSKKGEKIYEVS